VGHLRSLVGHQRLFDLVQLVADGLESVEVVQDWQLLVLLDDITNNGHALLQPPRRHYRRRRAIFNVEFEVALHVVVSYFTGMCSELALEISAIDLSEHLLSFLDPVLQL